MQNSWIVLLPPLLVILLASLTRKIFVSLIAGILSALLIVHQFSVPDTLLSLVKRIWLTTELGMLASWESFWQASYLFICLFLLLLGILLSLLRVSGSAYAYAHNVIRYLKNEKQAESASLFLSLFFFVDDYFSCLTVGSVMQTVTDRFRIPRAKLAFLVNSMAAPLAILVPISSWLADIIGQLRQSGITTQIKTDTSIIGDPFFVYLQTIPFMFYSLMIISAAWLIVLKRFSFGVLHKHEQIAQQTGNLFAGKTAAIRRMKEIPHEAIQNSSVFDFLLPIATLFISVIIAVLYFGNFYLFKGQNSFAQALQSTRIQPALFCGAFITLLISMIFLLFRKKITPKQLPEIGREGFQLMWSSVCMLILMWTLSTLLRADLAVGSYLANFLSNALKIQMLPVIFFLSAAFMATVMGTAWGTLSILIPIGIPMLVSLSTIQTPIMLEQLPMLFPLLGAIISGAVVGNHLSPLSDTMLMSSTSAGSYHIDLVKAQFDVTILSMIAAACAFLVSGFMINHFSLMVTMILSLTTGFLINYCLLWIRNRKK